MTLVKICGMTREVDVEAACALGVHALGFVLWPGSPRAVSLSRMAALVALLPPQVAPVAVFVKPEDDEVRRAVEHGAAIVQIHDGVGRTWRTPAPLWLAASLGNAAQVTGDATLLLDAYDPVRHGGTGRTIDWTAAAAVARARRVVLAGGLTPDNVADAVRRVRPYGVDVASGVEERPGIKSAQAMRAFVAAVSEADHDQDTD